MNYFPNNEEEISLIKFIAKYQYLSINDTKYFFSSSKYYKRRISNLVEKEYLKRKKLILSLDLIGIEYAKQCGFPYSRAIRDKRYLPRQLYVSSLGAFYQGSKEVTYTPSFAMKGPEEYTMFARRYVGVLDIGSIPYLAYSITKEHTNKYIVNVVYDIQKERKYRNIIIFANDISRVDIDKFTFGYNKVLVVEDTDENREKLKYMHNIDWQRIMQDTYYQEMAISEYSFCDYTDHKNKYVADFYFLDTEKIGRIKYFLNENKNKNIDIICSLELEDTLKRYLPSAEYHVIDFDKYINKERNIYG